MGRELDEARAAAQQRLTRRDDLRARMAIEEELRIAEDARANKRQFVADLADSPIQLVRGALLGISEWPQAFADAGVPHDPNEFHLINDPLRWISKTAKEGINAVFPAPQTTAGNLGEGIGRFVSTFVPVGRAIKLGTAAGTMTTAAVAGAAADFAAFEPAQQNLTALLREHAELRDPVTEFLATDPNDDAATNRLRNTVEGMAVGAALDGFVAGLKALRSVNRARQLQDVEKTARESASEIMVPEKAPEPVAAEAPRAEPGLPIKEEPVPKIEGTTPDQAAAVAGGTQSPTQTAIALRATGQTDLTDFNVKNIDWMKFGDKADDIFNIIELTSRSYAKQIDEAKGGVQTLAETSKLAELTGGTVEGVAKLYADLRGDDVGIAARMRAATEVMLASATRVRALAQNVLKTGDGRSELLIAIEQHAAIQAQVKGSQTEIARALHAMRALKGAAEIDPNLLARADSEKLLRQLAGEQPLTDLNAAVRRASGRRFVDYALEVWINGLLSGPVTHVVNFTSNTIKAVMSIPERGLAAGIGKLRQALGQDVERVRVQEAISVAHGTVQGLVDALRLPLRTLGKAGRAALQQWDLAAARQIIADDEKNFGNVYRSLARGHGIVDATTKLEIKEPALSWEIGNSTGMARWGIHAANLLGSTVRAPGAALQGADEFFKTVAYRQQLHALALRTALGEADKLPRAQREAFVSKRVAEILKDPPEDLQLSAISFSQQQTFTSKLGRVGQTVQTVLARHPMLRFVVPFVRTPMNILRDVWSYTPGPLVQFVRSDFRRQIAAGGAQADQMIARMTMGTAAMAGIWQLAEAGRITGGGPKGKDSGELGGVKPYSIRIGDTWLQYNRLEPLGMLFGLVADTNEIIERQYEVDGDNTKIEEVVGLVAMAAAKNVTSKTWLQGISDVMEAISDPERYGQDYLGRLATSFVPFSSALRTATSIEDPFAREVFTITDKLRAVIPGGSDNLPPRRDYLGRPVRHEKPWLSPVAISRESTDPVDRELARLEFELEMPDKSIDGIPLTASQYSRMLELRGTLGGEGNTLRDKLAELIAHPQYQELSDSPDTSITRGSKAAEIKRVVGRYSDAARRALLQEDPALLQKWQEARLHKAGAQ